MVIGLPLGRSLRQILLQVFPHNMFYYYCVYYIVCLYYMCVCIKIYTVYIQNGVFLASDPWLLYLELLASLLLLPYRLYGVKSLFMKANTCNFI